MTNDPNATKSVINNDQPTNISSIKFSFNVGKAAGPGFELNDLNGSFEVAVTDRNTEVQTNGYLKFCDQIQAGDLARMLVGVIAESAKNQERRRQERFDAEMKESEQRRKAREEEHDAYMAQHQKEMELLDARIAKIHEKDAE